MVQSLNHNHRGVDPLKNGFSRRWHFRQHHNHGYPTVDPLPRYPRAMLVRRAEALRQPHCPPWTHRNRGPHARESPFRAL
jgi:hypothetical protein